MKRCLMAKVVLQEKQELLQLPRHSLILDVRTRWNSLYLMLERFTEQYPAIQAVSLDQRLRKNMDRDRLARLTEEDFRKAEDFINLMKRQPPCKLPRKTPLEELFAEEEAQNIVSQQSSMSIKKRVERELQIYQEVPPVLMSEDPAAWWWNQQKTYPLLSDLVFSYLCIQASTPSERVFSTTGDTICPERSRILPEMADIITFLNKNCF